MRANSLYGGNIVEFIYNGGSNPGETRHVYVKSKDVTLAYCWDFDKQDTRNFNLDKMTNIRPIKDCKFVVLSELPNSVTANTIVSAFQHDGYKTYVADNRVIAINNKPVKSVIVNVYDTGSDGFSVFINAGPKCIGFYVNDNTLIIQANGVHNCITNPTADDLKKVLATLDL